MTSEPKDVWPERIRSFFAGMKDLMLTIKDVAIVLLMFYGIKVGGDVSTKVELAAVEAVEVKETLKASKAVQDEKLDAIKTAVEKMPDVIKE